MKQFIITIDNGKLVSIEETPKIVEKQEPILFFSTDPKIDNIITVIFFIVACIGVSLMVL